MTNGCIDASRCTRLKAEYLLNFYLRNSEYALYNNTMPVRDEFQWRAQDFSMRGVQ